MLVVPRPATLPAVLIQRSNSPADRLRRIKVPTLKTVGDPSSSSDHGLGKNDHRGVTEDGAQ